MLCFNRLAPIVLFLLLCTACRAKPDILTPEPTGQADLAVLTLAVEEINLNHYPPLIELFEQEHPEIEVRLVSTSEIEIANPDEEDSIRRLASVAEVFPYFNYLQPGTQYLLDLQPFVETDASLDKDDFHPGLLIPSPEPLWSLPTGVAYPVIYFDKEAFDETGLAYPELDWTTDDFLAAAQELTIREGGEVTRWGFVHNQLLFSPLVAAMLDGPLNVGGEIRLADPAVATAVQWVSDLFTVHEVSPWLEVYKPYEKQTVIGQSSQFALMGPGTAAMWQRTHIIFDSSNEQVGVTAIPRGPQGYAADPIQYGFAISRGTRNPEAAWMLLTFLSRQPPQETIAPLLSPARRSVAASTNYWGELPPALVPTLQYATENNVAPSLTYDTANLLLEAFVAHIEENRPIQDALVQELGTQATQPDPPATEVMVVPEIQTESPVDVEQITFATSFTFLDTHRLLANQFQREHPDISIRVVEGEYVPNRVNTVAGSDCFLTYADNVDKELRAELLPLGPLLELDGSLQAEAFYPVLLNELLADDELWGLPAGMGVPYLEYNRELFLEANVSPPSLDWDLEGFLELAQTLTKGEGKTKQYGYAEIFFPFLFNNGTQMFGVQVVDRSEVIPQFDYTAISEMVTWYANLVRLYGVQPLISDEPGVGIAVFEALLRGSRVAMWPSGLAELILVRDNTPLDFEIGIASMPAGPSGFRGHPTIFAYYIFAGSPHRDACWEWIKFLSINPSALNPSGSTGKFFPAHVETATSAEYLDQAGEDYVAVAQTFVNVEQGPQPTVINSVPEWMSPGSIWLREVYWKTASGEVDVMTALAQAEEKFTQYRECVIQANAFDDYSSWRECAIQVDPGLRNVLAEPAE